MTAFNSSRLSGRALRTILFLSILATTSSGLKAQNVAQKDSTKTKERTEVGATLFKFKENVINLFNQGNDKVDSAKKQEESIFATDTTYVKSDLANAIDNTRLKERHAKEHITGVAAKDVIANMENTFIHQEYAPYTYGELRAQNGGDLNKTAAAVVALTERPVGASAEQARVADALYETFKDHFHTRNARFQKSFVASTVRPDVKKGEQQSAFIKQLNTPSQLAAIMPEEIILSALNTPEHIREMTEESITENDNVASLERLIGFASVDLGAGDAQKLFRLVLDGKSDDKLSNHFKYPTAIANNIVIPYDHNNQLKPEDITVGTLANMEIAKYIMANAGVEEENKLFVLKENVVLQTKEEKLAQQPVPQSEETDIVTQPSANEEGIKFSNLVFLASSEQNIHISEVNGTVASPMMFGARFTTGNLKKDYETNEMLGNRVELTAKLAMGATYSQDGSFTTQSYTPVVSNQAVGLLQLQGAYLTGANSFYVRYAHLSNNQDGQNMAIKEGGNGFTTLGYNANILNAVTRKGNQYSLNTGIEHTRSASVDATTNVTANIHSIINRDKGLLKHISGTTIDFGAKLYTDGAGQFNLTLGIPLGKKNRKVIEYNEHAQGLINSATKPVLVTPGHQAYFNRGLR